MDPEDFDDNRLLLSLLLLLSSCDNVRDDGNSRRTTVGLYNCVIDTMIRSERGVIVELEMYDAGCFLPILVQYREQARDDD